MCVCVRAYVCACLLPSVSQEKSGLGNLIFYFPRSHVSRHTHTRGNVDSYDRVVRCQHKPLFTHQNTNTRNEVGWNRTRDRSYRADTDLRIVARGNRDWQLLHLALLNSLVHKISQSILGNVTCCNVNIYTKHIHGK